MDQFLKFLKTLLGKKKKKKDARMQLGNSREAAKPTTLPVTVHLLTWEEELAGKAQKKA